MSQSKALHEIAATHLSNKDLPGDIDYQYSSVAGVACYLLRTALQNHHIYQEVVPVVRAFTPAERQYYAKYAQALYASLYAEANASLARSIADELRGI